MNRYFTTLSTLLLISILSFAQKKDIGESFETLQRYAFFKYDLNWQNLDPTQDKVMGTSVDRAYKELLKDKKAKKTIVVAVIDGGVDVKHEDLKGQIWVNEDEIPGNGIDDDNNGYIDDINGWNFIGNAKGENMTYSHSEHARLVRKYQNKFKNVESDKGLSPEDARKYKIYKNALKGYNKELKRFTSLKEWCSENQKKTKEALTTLSDYKDKKGMLAVNDLKKLKPKNKAEKEAKKYLLKRYKYYKYQTHISEDSSDRDYKMIRESIAPYLDYHLNTEWDARALIGDNEEDLSDIHYGNNIVDGNGYNAGHGTFVAGLIAANRNNNIGINGIAENVKIMALRVVPNGDEYDKDVALAIKYAIDNGAQVINMSFGKYYSDNKYMVDKVLKEAMDKNILLFHAAGNESLNNDVTEHYPTEKLIGGETIENWLSIGASSQYADKDLPASFSNYGQKTVDFFAPGHDVISTYPQNTYKQASGTSFACPVSAGVAALVWSYYPELSAKELKEILHQSVTHYNKRVIKPKSFGLFNWKKKFSKLSITGGIVNAYKALQEAEKRSKQ